MGNLKKNSTQGEGQMCVSLCDIKEYPYSDYST